MLRTISRRAAIAAAAISVSSLLIQTTFATDFGYTAATGDWTTGANWIDPGAGTGVSPGAADNAYIGASYPGGAISTAAVSLTSVESVNYLILGQSLTDAGTLDLQAGSSLTIGSYLQIGGTSTVLRNGGSLTLPSLTIYAANTLDIVSGDTVNAGGSFQLYSASTLNYDNSSAGPIFQTLVYDGSTLDLQGGTFHTSYLYMGSTTGGIVTRSGGLLDVQVAAYLSAGSTLDIAAGDSFASSTVSLTAGSTLNLNANNLTTNTLSINDTSTVNRGGANVFLTSLNVTGGAAFSIVAGDDLATGGNINVNGTGSTLDFNAPVANTLNNTQIYDGGVLNLNGNTLHTSNLQVGSSTPGTITRGGGFLDLTSVQLYVGSTLDIVSGDTVNAGGSFQLYSASTLNYDNSSAGPIYQTNVYDGSTLNLQGGTFHTSYLYMGSTTGGIVTRSGGLLDVQNTAYLYAASTLNLQAGDQIGQTLYFVSGGSVASLVQNANDITGLTLNGGSAGNLIFTDPNDVLSLTFDGNVINGLDWVFRWANPGIGFDHVGDINGWITSGNIVVLGNPQPYSVFDNGDGFTYIGYIGETGIPEPTSLAAIALSACMFMRRRRGA